MVKAHPALGKALRGITRETLVHHGTGIGLTRDTSSAMDPVTPPEATPVALLVAERMPAAQRDTLALAALRNRLIHCCRLLGRDPSQEVRELRAMATAFPQFRDAYTRAADEVASWLGCAPERSWADPEADAACTALVEHKARLQAAADAGVH